MKDRRQTSFFPPNYFHQRSSSRDLKYTRSTALDANQYTTGQLSLVLSLKVASTAAKAGEDLSSDSFLWPSQRIIPKTRTFEDVYEKWNLDLESIFLEKVLYDEPNWAI